MAMIPIDTLQSNQFDKARGLNLPVVVVDACTFRLPSSSRGEREHKVQLDDPEKPRALSCTCEAGRIGRPCWAMARALDALKALRDQNVYVCRGAVSYRSAREDLASAFEPAPVAGIVEGGDMALFWKHHPANGVLYAVRQ